MSLITLIFYDELNPNNSITETISWDSLFGQSGLKSKDFIVYDQKVTLKYEDYILNITSSNDVDIIFDCDKSLPIRGLSIITSGYLEITGLPMYLAYGLLAKGDDIELNTEIRTPGLTCLDVSKKSHGNFMQLNGSIKINDSIKTDKLFLIATDVYISSNVTANLSVIIYELLTIDAFARLVVGSGQVEFKKKILNSIANDSVPWNQLTSYCSEYGSKNVSCILKGKKLTQNGILKLNKAELHNAGDITYGILSKTTYDDVNIFSSGGMKSHEKSFIDGKNVYLGFEKDINISGECKIDNLTITGHNLNVTGLLLGEGQLNTKLTGVIVNNGHISFEHPNVSANAILTSCIKNDRNCIFGILTQGGIVGTKSLTINALAVMVAGGGYIKAPNIQYRVGFFVNLAGAVCAYNVVDRSIFSIDLGLNLPCSPTSFYDLTNADKMFRLSCRVLGNSFPMLRNAATLGSLAAPLGSMIKSGVVTTANGASSVAVGLYYNPKKQAQRVVDGASYLKDGVLSAPGVISETVKSGAKSVADSASDAYKEGLIKKSQDNMNKISQAWHNTRWLDLLNYLLAMQDWYISADMIMMRGTNALIFANDVKNCMKDPQATIDGIMNGMSVMTSDIKNSLTDPNLVNTVVDAVVDEIQKAAEIPGKAINKMGSQVTGVFNAITNPVEAIAQTLNTVTFENAKKSLIDPINKRKDQLLEAGNNLCFGENQVTTAIEPNCETPQMDVGDVEPNCETSNEKTDVVEPNCEEPQTEDDENNHETPQIVDKPVSVTKKDTTLRDTVFDMALIFAPSVDRRAAVSMRFGFTITGSEMEDTLFSSHNGVSISLASSSYTMFGYHNSGGIYSNTRYEVVGNRYNTGDVHVGAMNLSANNNEEYGDFQYSTFVFDIKRDFNTGNTAKMSNNRLFSGTVGGNFYGGSDFVFSHGKVDIGGNYVVAKDVSHVIAGDAQMNAKNTEVHGHLTTKEDSSIYFETAVIFKDGKYTNQGTPYSGDTLTFRPGSSVELIEDLINVNKLDDQGAEVIAKDHITLAKEFKRAGRWVYNGYLHEQFDTIETTQDSLLEKADDKATYSVHSRQANLNGPEKHVNVQASFDEMPSSEAVAYGVGLGKYSGIDVAESVYVTTKSEHNAEYAGTRANGARVQVQTNGRITLPPQFERARGMTFANYEEAIYFVRTVYPTYNLPLPEPKKPHGIKKHLNRISKFMGTVASVFAGSGEPITMAIGAVIGGTAIAVDKADKHYERKADKDLEKRELERTKLQQRLNEENLVLQERSTISNLVNQEHMKRVGNAANQLTNSGGTQGTQSIANELTLEDAKQEALQHYAAAREELADQTQRNLADISYHHARHREHISRMGGPVIGGGIAIQAGSSGVSTFATISAGNPGLVVTGGVQIANHDFNRPPLQDSYPDTAVPRQRPRIEEIVDENYDESPQREIANNSDIIYTNLNVGLSVDERLTLTAPSNIYPVNSKVTIEEIYTETDTFLNDIQLAPEDISPNRAAAISPENRYQFAEKPTMNVLFAAISGNIYAKQEMRKRAETLAKFFDSIDPDLKPLTSDNAVMAELKMYGRSAKNVRDQFMHAVSRPDEVVKDAFLLGADVIEAGLYYYGGKDYYQPALQRNDARMAAFEQLLHADGLIQREAILTAGLSAIMTGVPGRATGASVIAKPGKPIVPAFKKKSKINSTVNKQTGYGHYFESADEAYNAIRMSNDDVVAISRNTGIKKENIQKVKEHLFLNEHLLDRYVEYGIPAEMKVFDSDIAIANAWKRLEFGAHTQYDLQLLKHEAAEAWFMKKHGPSYTNAHNAADRRFPAPDLEKLNQHKLASNNLSQ